jgi:hypothetical protein
MTKMLLVSIAAAIPLVGQTPSAGNSFQQNGWLHVPEPSAHPITMPIDGQSGPIVGKPLSATEVRRSEQVLSDGSHISNSETEHFYRDSSGRMRTETSAGAIIFDPVGGFTYHLADHEKTYTKVPIPANSVMTIAAAVNRDSTRTSTGNSRYKQGSGAVTEELTPQSVNGVMAKGARITVTIPAGKIGNDRDLHVVSERWYSDDLKVLLKSSNSDPRFGVTTYELTEISQTPPDPALFQVPSDYTEKENH